MIDDKLLEQLSSLLDNQLPPEQRRALEEKIANDPAVRAEWDALRQFAGVIAGTAPLPVEAPSDFRAKILDRLQGAAPTTSAAKVPGKAVKGTAGGSLFSFFSLPAYAAAGAVLAGLVATMVYLDYQSHKNIRKPAPQGVDLSTLATPVSTKLSPEFRGTQTTVSPADIQSGAVLAKPTQTTGLDVQGGVYTIGQGKALSVGHVSHPWHTGMPEPSTEVMLDEPAQRAAVGLESTSAWNLDQVNRALTHLQATATPAARVLQLAQKNHLNPGLLCAALQTFPGLSVEELALDLRMSLNASVKLPEDARLKKCVQDLGGAPAVAAEWKKYLQP